MGTHQSGGVGIAVPVGVDRQYAADRQVAWRPACAGSCNQGQIRRRQTAAPGRSAGRSSRCQCPPEPLAARRYRSGDERCLRKTLRQVEQQHRVGCHPAVTVNGDQPCMNPRARTRKPWVAAQLQMSTTFCGERGSQVQTFGTARSPAQLVNGCRASGTSAGKSGECAVWPPDELDRVDQGGSPDLVGDGLPVHGEDDVIGRSDRAAGYRVHLGPDLIAGVERCLAEVNHLSLKDRIGAGGGAASIVRPGDKRQVESPRAVRTGDLLSLESWLYPSWRDEDGGAALAAVRRVATESRHRSPLGTRARHRTGAFLRRRIIEGPVKEPSAGDVAGRNWTWRPVARWTASPRLRAASLSLSGRDQPSAHRSTSARTISSARTGHMLRSGDRPVRSHVPRVGIAAPIFQPVN